MSNYVLLMLAIGEVMYISLESWHLDNFQLLVNDNKIQIIEQTDTIIVFKRIA